MRCLIVGGTGFLGGAIADCVAAAGHETSLLSRGQTTRSQRKDVETIIADRYENLSVLNGRDFDWVFDTCAYTPDSVSDLLDAVGKRLTRYVMVSSISAYGSFTKCGLTESDPVPDASEADCLVSSRVPKSQRASAFAYGASYGPLKRAGEIVAAEYLGEKATALRVGLLVGAGDYTDRLTWWVRRIDEGSEEKRFVPAPGPSTRPVQLIDVRDAANFALHCAESELAGIWNVTGRPMPFAELLNTVVRVTESPAEIVWIDESIVLEAGIEPWTDLPLMASCAPEFKYFLQVSAERAHKAGLHCRPLDQTLSRLLNWDRSCRDRLLKCGLTRQQEIELLSQ